MEVHLYENPTNDGQFGISEINNSENFVKMKLSGLFLGAVFADPVERASRDFGIKYASCDGHFRPGKAWPLQDF